MPQHYHPRWVHHHPTSPMLAARDYEADALDYNHGLTGVDQTGNFLWVHVLIITLCALAGFSFALSMWHRLEAHFRHMNAMSNAGEQSFWKYNRTTWWPWLDRHVFMAPLGHRRKNRAFQLSSAIDNGTLPGRFQLALLVVYFMCNIAYTLALPWGRSDAHSVVAALRGRAGTLAALNLVPTILFALRNNPLIPILGVSYDDFNLFHRWGARLVIFEAVVHTLAWFANTMIGGGFPQVKLVLATEASYTWGMVGTACFCFIFIQASAPVRHAFYETFLAGHRLAVALAIAGVWVHLDLHMLPQLPWLKIALSFWVLEWVCRIIRIVYFNFKFGKKSKVTVEAMPGEACKVTVNLVRGWKPQPGCHAHVYLPKFAWFHSHPFSIAWSEYDHQPSKDMLPVMEKAVAPYAPRTSHQVSFICRARTGLTRKMYDYACQQPNQIFTTWGGIEGPYGGHHSLDSYGTVVLFAGGVGITHQPMYIRHLIDGYYTRRTATQKILLVWTIPDSECLEWIRPWMDQILRMPDRKKVLRIMLFITRPKKGRLESASETVKMIPGRCDADTLLEKEIRERVGAMCVTVCGSGAFSDSIRAATRARVEQGSIDFVEEAFTY